MLTLSRPHRLNALTATTFRQIADAVNWIGGVPGCRAVVLTGDGRAFCAGMDLADRGTGNLGADDDPVEARVATLRTAVAVVTSLRDIPQPVIAAVRGHAVGAGFAYAAACDIRVCAPDASFNAGLVTLGVSGGDLGLSWYLPRLVGPALAAEILYTGGKLDAEQAFKTGLVSRVVDDPVRFGGGELWGEIETAVDALPWV